MIESSHLEFVKLMALVPLEQRRKSGQLEQWSIKDELLHLVYWLEVFCLNLQAQKSGKPLIDISDYLALNDQTWLERNKWTWKQLEAALEVVFANLETELKNLDEREFIFAVDKKPLANAVVYELFTHPLHHFQGIYNKLGLLLEREAMLKRVLVVLERRGFSRFTARTRKKILGYLEASA